MTVYSEHMDPSLEQAITTRVLTTLSITINVALAIGWIMGWFMIKTAKDNVAREQERDHKRFGGWSITGINETCIIEVERKSWIKRKIVELMTGWKWLEYSEISRTK